jgi:hypothetical protein
MAMAKEMRGSYAALQRELAETLDRSAGLENETLRLRMALESSAAQSKVSSPLHLSFYPRR